MYVLMSLNKQLISNKVIYVHMYVCTYVVLHIKWRFLLRYYMPCFAFYLIFILFSFSSTFYCSLFVLFLCILWLLSYLNITFILSCVFLLYNHLLLKWIIQYVCMYSYVKNNRDIAHPNTMNSWFLVILHCKI